MTDNANHTVENEMNSESSQSPTMTYLDAVLNRSRVIWHRERF